MSIFVFNQRRITSNLLLAAALGCSACAHAAEVVVTRVAVPGAHYGWADVLRVSPVYGVARAEHQQECVDQPVVVHDGRRAGSTLLGAVVGGVLGSTVGKGDGRTAATVVGAVAGGAVGSAAGRRQSYETTAASCRDVVVVNEGRPILGYDVEYRYHGEIFASRLGYDPGVRVRVRIDVSPVG
jgi:uncharacterized protein YcfJ